MLNKVTGPECPDCGCRDSWCASKSRWFGDTHERRQCRHCGRVWTAKAEKDEPDEQKTAVTYHVLRCPMCNSTKVPVQRTDRPLRYHKCSDCGETFKSVEKMS